MITSTVAASDGSSVSVAWWEVPNDDGPTTIEVSAQIGATQVNCRMTLGSTETPPASVTQDSMQADLNVVRQKMADFAAAREASRKLLLNLT